MKYEIKACLAASLETTLDSYMARHGFVRRAKSLIYNREYQGFTESINIEVQIHPKDNLNAAAAVYPIMEVHVPEVDRVLEDIIGDNIGLLEGVTKGPVEPAYRVHLPEG